MKILQHVQHPTQPIEVEAVAINTAADMIELRDSDWHDGQLAVLTFPTAPPVGYIAPSNPKYLLGRPVVVGDTILKGPAGDLEVFPEAWVL